MSGKRTAQIVLVWCFTCITYHLSLSTVFAADEALEPSFGHGAQQVARGVLLEWPFTVLDAAYQGPPVIGPAAGALVGVVRALQTIGRGVKEMSAGFDPWGAKRHHR